MQKDFLYANAPLVEVIAEIHWELQPIQTVPNGAIDPHYKIFESEFLGACAKKGLNRVEETVPDAVPRELLGHQIVRRIRMAPNIWPLYQIGPGVLAMNIVPPYKGWQEFIPFIVDGIDILLSSYPVADRYLKFEKLHLRYIDAFTSKHGVTDRAEYVREDLSMAADLPDRITKHAAKTEEPVLQSSTAIIKLNKPSGANGHIKIETGYSRTLPAVIGTFVIESQSDATPQNREGILAWFNDAHLVIHDWFDATVSNRVKDLMGPKKEIE